MMSKLTEPHKLALAAALSFALGAGAMSLGDDGAPATLPEAAQAVGRKLDPALVVDVARYRAAVAPAKAACGPGCVDLLSAPCDPGQTCATGGNFQKGARVEDAEAVGAFSTPTLTCSDRDDFTWCEVTARNTSDKAQRLLVLVKVAVP